MAYFPFMIELKQQKCVIGGGGKVAARKVKTMLEFGAEVTVIAPEISTEILGLKDAHLTIKQRGIIEEDLMGAVVVILATDDERVNSRMAAFCRENHILVNVADVKEECGFFFPAIIKQEDVVIAVSTGGDSPLLAARIKKEIQKNLNSCYGRLADTLGRLREQVLDTVDSISERKAVFAGLIEQGMQQEGNIMPEQVEKIMKNCGKTKELPEKEVIRIGTRGSALALVQTDMVIERLEQEYPYVSFEKVILSTKGDREKDRPLLEFGGKAVFVEEFEEAILDETIDMAVHSAKDMPAVLAQGLTIAGTLPRADVRDVLIYRKDSSFAKKVIKGIMTGEKQDFGGYVAGTGSLRRQYQIRDIYPGIRTKPLRGNVNTRLKKLQNKEYDAIILAAAGIQRLGLDREEKFEYQYLSCQEMLPAACQAIIAIETKKQGKAYEMAVQISDSRTMLQFQTERKVLEILQADCKEPIGVYVECEGEQMQLQLMQVKEEKVCRTKVSGSSNAWEALAFELTKERG